MSAASVVRCGRGGRLAARSCVSRRPLALRGQGNPFLVLIAIGMVLVWLGTGCGSHDAPEPAAAEEAERKLFHEGHGLKLSEQTRRALGVQSARAGPQTVHRQVLTTAQVFARRTNEHGAVHALASALVPASVQRPATGTRVAIYGSGTTNQAVVAQVDETSSSALGKTEVVIEMEDAAGRWPMGRFVEARLDAGVVEAAVAVPRGALVRAGLGDFLYVADGEFLKRVRVKTAAEDAAWIEIVEGVSSGQNVVTHGAESLWLLELSEVGGMANIK